VNRPFTCRIPDFTLRINDEELVDSEVVDEPGDEPDIAL
jgi:hypothetical protein